MILTEAHLWGIVSVILGCCIGVIGYFLKRTHNHLDEAQKEINALKSELERYKSESRSKLMEFEKEVSEELGKNKGKIEIISERSESAVKSLSNMMDLKFKMIMEKLDSISKDTEMLKKAVINNIKS